MQGDQYEDMDLEMPLIVQARVTAQLILLECFWNKDFLTWLREFHRMTDKNEQTLKPGTVVLVRDDTHHVKWRLASAEDIVMREDRLVVFDI